MQSFLSILVIVAVSVVSKVSANTAGTGSCAAGIAAIGGTHLDYGPTSPSQREGAMGSLTEVLTSVQLGGTTLVAGVPSTVPANTDLTWTVTAGQTPSGIQIAYKGIFVRVQADASNLFTNVGNQADLQNVILCDALTENVVGVSHTNAAAKTTNSGVLNFSAEGSATMDVSIVFDNTYVSVFAFASFPITIGTVTPVAPTIAPSDMASDIMSYSPSDMISDMPIDIVSDPPVAAVPGAPTAPGVPTAPTVPGAPSSPVTTLVPAPAALPAPFRNSATDAANTILVNTKLILPPPSDGIQESIIVFPINGVIQLNPTDGGSITYTPNIDFVGSDAFTIQQCRSNNAMILDDAECQSFMVMVKVMKKSSSSSSGLYGLFALLLLPLLLAAAYWVYRRQKGEDDNEVTAPVVSDMIRPNNSNSETILIPSSHNNSNSETILIPSGLVAEIPAQLTSLDMNTGSDYQVTQKDQCRSVVGKPIRIVDAVAIPNEYKPLDAHAVPAVAVNTTLITRDTVSGSSVWEV
jgi:hypothetical protein